MQREKRMTLAILIICLTSLVCSSTMFAIYDLREIIKTGGATWKDVFHRDGCAKLPVNAKGNLYSGVNVLNLYMAQLKNNFKCSDASVFFVLILQIYFVRPLRNFLSCIVFLHQLFLTLLKASFIIYVKVGCNGFDHRCFER